MINKRNKNPLIAKIAILNGGKVEINLLELSNKLNAMNMNKLHIFSINKINKNSFITISKDPELNYIEVGIENFIEILKDPNKFFGHNFLEINKNALFIFRDCNYIDIKNIFAKIEEHEVNIGRAFNQKSHIMSPLEFRLSFYLLAIYNFNYNLISSINSFNNINKNRYLLFTDIKN
jgi:hypothetical protein